MKDFENPLIATPEDAARAAAEHAERAKKQSDATWVNDEAPIVGLKAYRAIVPNPRYPALTEEPDPAEWELAK